MLSATEIGWRISGNILPGDLAVTGDCIQGGQHAGEGAGPAQPYRFDVIGGSVHEGQRADPRHMPHRRQLLSRAAGRRVGGALAARRSLARPGWAMALPGHVIFRLPMTELGLLAGGRRPTAGPQC